MRFGPEAEARSLQPWQGEGCVTGLIWPMSFENRPLAVHSHDFTMERGACLFPFAVRLFALAQEIIP